MSILCSSQPSTEKFLHVVDGDKCENSQMVKMQRISKYQGSAQPQMEHQYHTRQNSGTSLKGYNRKIVKARGQGWLARNVFWA